MFTVATYNIHKGHSFTRGCSVTSLKTGLSKLAADIVCLQEVQDVNTSRITQHGHSQLAALQGEDYPYHAYGANAFYDHGHHGNAILSKFPIHSWQNFDVSDHRLEQRGILHVVIEHPNHGDLHVICAHFGLFKVSRVRQAAALVREVNNHVPHDAPLIIAGDFNDWRNEASELLAKRLDLEEVFGGVGGDACRPGRSYPAKLPMLRLDRIYVRGLSVSSAFVHSGSPWSKISDHAALSAHLLPRSK